MIHTALMEVIDGLSTKSRSVPFLGRKEELAIITAFCNEVRDGDEPAVCWIQGEAGIGKSALVREAERRLKGNDRIVLSTCLYPDSLHSLIPLLANRLSADEATNSLLVDQVTPSLPSVLAALRRLARLRPLVLILEDLHLMTEESGTELLSLLHGLHNESLALLCISRIESGEAYSRLLPYIRKTLDIPPLSRTHVEELTNTTLLQSLAIDGTMLYEASRGYPLILQGLIAELYNLRASNPDFGKSDQGRRALLGSRAAISIKGLTDAFLSGLTKGEKEATRRLAILGELFSRQAADLLTSDIPELFDHLLEKGIVVRATTFSLPLYGSYDSVIPYRFNHTLLFEELLRKAVVGEEEIITIIERKFPLYSLTIFQQLEKVEEANLGPERIEQVIRILLEEARKQDMRFAFNQKIASLLCTYAKALYGRYKECFDPSQQHLISLALIGADLQTVRQQKFVGGHLEQLEEFTRMTESPESEQVAVYRCLCLSNRLHHYYERHEETLAALNEVEELADRFPTLLRANEFIYTIAYLATKCSAGSDDVMLWRTYDLFNRIMLSADPATQASNISFAGTQLFYSLSVMAETQKELEDAIAFGNGLRERLAPYWNERDALIMNGICAYIFLNSGCLSDAMQTFHHYRVPILHSRDVSMLYIKRTLIGAQSAIGVPIPQLEERYLEHLKETQEIAGSVEEKSPNSLPRLQWILATDVLVEGYMRGNTRWAEELSLRIIRNNAEGLRGILPLNRAAALGNREGLRGFVDHPIFGSLIRAVLEEEGSMTKAVETIRQFLRRGGISKPTLLEFQTMLDLVGMIRIANPLQPELEEMAEEIADGIRQVINWCIQKRMPGYAEPFLRFGTTLLPEREHARLSDKIERLIMQIPEEIRIFDLIPPKGREGHVELSLIGTISATHASQPPQRFQGARVRRMVALIAANQLMQRPLSLSEFRHIATGMDPDSEKAASYARTLLWRIRSVLGPDSIIADGETPPRFDTRNIRVNLLEAAASLTRCMQGVREARPRQAREALSASLTILGQGTVYPTFFDEFFEAARLDFEIRLRDTVRSTIALLRKEGDLEEAERILRTALYSMPGDDELTEEMAEILSLLGRNAEAVAIRSRMERQSRAA